MSARDRILDRIRRQSAATARAARVAARLDPNWSGDEAGGPPPGPVPAAARIGGAARLARFMAQLTAADATVSRVSTLAELPRAVADELRNRNLPTLLRTGTEPLFQGLDWGNLVLSQGAGRIEEPVTLSRARYGIAETGTLVLESGPDNPVTLTFLGETHFVVLDADAVLGGFEALWSALRAGGTDPRTVNLVTGPSRSADIGQVLQLGAHGPVALHVFLVGAVEGADGPA